MLQVSTPAGVEEIGVVKFSRPIIRVDLNLYIDLGIPSPSYMGHLGS